MYKPPPGQIEQCKSCEYWRPAGNPAPGVLRICHYLLDTRERKGPDPCTRYKARLSNRSMIKMRKERNTRGIGIIKKRRRQKNNDLN